jgi:hypothetical protein
MPRALLLTGLIVVAVFSRLLPHMPNFTPLGAIALLAAAYFRRWWVGILVPLIALLLSDFALEITTRWHLLDGWIANGWGFYSFTWAVYASTAVAGAVGLLLRRKRTILNVSASAVASAVVFFLLTNFAWWLTELSGLPPTLSGLMTAYVDGLPFFKWTLLSNIGYAGLLFGVFALVERWKPGLEPAAS